MSEWKKTYLRDLIVIKNGKDHKKLKNGQYPVYGSGGIMRYADSYLYDQESVLLPRKGTLNNIQFVTEPFWTVDTCYYTVVNRDKVLPYFLYCCLCKMDIQSLNTGSAVPSMTFEKYYSIEVPIPPLSTQNRIATILSRYDSLIENYQKQIKLLEEAAQRLYKEWFVDLRFPGHENTKIVDGVPEGWEKKKVGEIAPIITGKKDANFGTPNGEYPFFTCSQEPIKAPSFSFDCAAILLAGNGDFNVKLYRGKFEAYQRTYVLSPYCAQHLYLLYYTISANMTKLAAGSSGSTIKFLTKGMIDGINLNIPNDEILRTFNKKVEPIQSSRESLQSQLRLLTEARDRLLPKLMSGEIEI